MHKLTAADVMTAPAVTIDVDATLAEAARTMIEHGISGAPVVAEGRVVGLITVSDLLEKEAGRHGHPLEILLPWRSDAVDAQARRLEARSVAEAMTSPPVSVRPDTPVHEIAALLSRRGISRVPVLQDDCAVGVVSRHDVLKVFTRGDGEISRDVRATLLHDLVIDPRLLRIEVHDGVVTIAGSVDRRSDVAMVEKFILAIDGVIGAELGELAFRVDDRP